jgi:hypothetical protein
MLDDSLESAATGRKVSRRWLLRSTANLTAGVVAASTVSFAAADAAAEHTAENREANAAAAPDHDPMTGEIFDRERHHHWDTV